MSDEEAETLVWRKMVDGLRTENEALKRTVEELSEIVGSRRTNGQNRRLFAIYKALSEYTGHSKAEIHDHFKARWLVETTRYMGQPDFSEFMTYVEASAARMGVSI